MRRGVALAAAVAVVSVTASSCSGSTHDTTPAASTGQAAPAATQSGNELRTTVEYSGVFDEKIHEDYSGDQLIRSVDRHQHFSFRESVSLTTTAASLARPVQGTSPVSDSVDNPLTFQLSGTITERDTPDVAGGASCSGTLSGKTDLADWSHPTDTSAIVRPPVEIAIDARDPTGAVAKTYGLQISAEVPTTGPHGRAITLDVTGPNSAGYCSQTGVLDSRAVQSSPDCIAFAAPGPVDANFLLLPLDTEDYRKTFSCDKTLPYSSGGVTGTDVVTGSSTLTVNAKGAAYVALGDSFSSGDFPPFQDDTCQRSFLAYPYLYDSKVDFLACLARSTSQIAAQQVPSIPANAQIISITAGGDDLDLAGIVATCAFRQVKVVTCRAPPDLSRNLARAQANLIAMFQQIHRDKAPKATIYILGYPNPMPTTFTRGSCPALEDLIVHVNPTGVGLGDIDMALFARLNDEINAAAEAAAKAGGATYVRPDPSFEQHTVCSADPWFFPLTLANNLSSTSVLHPNQAGQRELEQELFAAAGPAPD